MRTLAVLTDHIPGKSRGMARGMARATICCPRDAQLFITVVVIARCGIRTERQGAYGFDHYAHLRSAECEHRNVRGCSPPWLVVPMVFGGGHANPVGN